MPSLLAKFDVRKLIQTLPNCHVCRHNISAPGKTIAALCYYNTLCVCVYLSDTSIGSPVISTALGCGRSGTDCPEQATRGFSQPVRIVLPLSAMV